jgi:protein O-mannosyl-transferase
MDYGRTPLLIRTTWGWIWTSAIVLGLAALMLRRHASREWWTAAGLFVAGLLPVCGLVPFAFQEISTVADRYVYLAMLGAALAAAWLWTRLGGVWQKGAVAVALCAFAVQSFFAAGHWHDSDALYAQALRVNPSSWCALHNQAVLRWRRGDADSAVAELQRALQLRPQHANGWHTLGSCLQALDRPADALHALEEAVRHSPGDHRFRLSLARELAAQQRTEESIRNLEESLSIRPNDPGTLTDAGAILSRLNRTQEAIDLFQRAVRIDPSFWQARLNLGLAYDQQQRWGDAAREFGAVLTARPDHSEVRFQRALALAREQHYAMAIREMERVRREASEQNHSQLAEAATQELMIIHNSLGVEALDKNRWDVAEQEFEAAIALHPEFAAGHFNLGRARAGRGATAAARTAYETALSLLPPDSAEARDVAEMLSRLPPSGNTPDVSGEPRKN